MATTLGNDNIAIETDDGHIPDRPASDATAQIPEDPVRRSYVHSPVDVLRVIVGAVLVVIGVIFANSFDTALLGFSEDIRDTMPGIPQYIRNLPSTILAVAVIGVVGASIIWATVTTRFRRLILLISAFVGAAALSVIVGGFILAVVDVDVRAAFDLEGPLFRYRDGNGNIHPSDPLLAGSIAMLAIGSAYLSRKYAYRLAWLVVGYALLSVIATSVPPIAQLTDIGLGVFVGSALLLISGRPDLAPSGREISESLRSIGIQVDGLAPLDVDARASRPWIVEREGQSNVFVKALSRNERSADIMFRAYRWFVLRRAGDHRPFVSLQRAVEHEALVALQASSLGIRTPKVLGVAEVGIDGMVLAYEAIEGKSADLVDELSDETLDAIWTMVHKLHRAGIAHRDLRLANIFIEPDGTPMLIDFGFSELAASDQLLGTDVAELLAATAVVVGAERAVASAHRSSGLAELGRAMPWLQPMALSGATRKAVGGDKPLAEIRHMLLDSCGIEHEEPVKLSRINAKTIFVIVTIGLSIFFLAPQLANLDAILSEVRNGSIGWVLAAVAFSVLTYVFATAALLGAIPTPLRFGPALAAQVASSFANRVTPAKVGGVATNIRYFQRQGISTVHAVTAVSLNVLAGVVMHVSLVIAFLLLASGAGGEAELPIPSLAVIGIGALGAAAVAAVSWFIPYTNRLIRNYVFPQIKSAGESIGQIARSPSRLGLLFGGSALITLFNVLAMFASLEAFGSTVSLPVVGLIWLTAGAVANAAPTPGGLGVAEAALIAGYVTVTSSEIAVAAVFLFRLVTFWLPILPGWLALTWLQKTNRI